MKKFKAGDHVRRTFRNHNTVVVGCIYCVEEMPKDHSLVLVGHGGTYDPAFFELVVDTPPRESDPTGRKSSVPGAKLDAGKVQPSLFIDGCPRAIWKVSEVMTYGANKYSPNGWVTVPDGIKRYNDAKYRHILKEAMGQVCDEDTKLEHLAHEACNAMFRLELYLREKEAKGAASVS